MNGAKQKGAKWIGSFLGGMALFWLVSLNAWAIEVPASIRELVEREYPGARVTEIRKDVWNGRPATEVEFQTSDGALFEMALSESGEILNIEEEKGLPWIGGELMVGIGVMVEQEIYKGMDTEVQPVPFLRYENGPFEIQTGENIEAAFQFFETGGFSAAALGYLAFDAGYDRDDSDFLEGMEELDTLYGVGLSLEQSVSDWELGLEVLQDLSGEHDGQQVELSVAYPWNVGRFEIRPELALTWLSKESVDYFYGVSAGEVRPDRPADSPNSSYEIGLGLLVQRPIYGDLTAVGYFEFATFGDEITDSPLVDEEFSYEGILGVMYTF